MNNELSQLAHDKPSSDFKSEISVFDALKRWEFLILTTLRAPELYMCEGEGI